MKITITDDMAIELIDALAASHDSGEVDDLKRIRDLVDTLLLYIPDPRGAQAPRVVVEPPVERIVLKPKGKLTPNQREVYGRIAQLSRRGRDPWVEDRNIGSKNTCDRLAEKGWIHIDVHYGPAGGAHRFYRPTEEAS
jgi:hypothetical protein